MKISRWSEWSGLTRIRVIGAYFAIVGIVMWAFAVFAVKWAQEDYSDARGLIWGAFVCFIVGAVFFACAGMAIFGSKRRDDGPNDDGDLDLSVRPLQGDAAKFLEKQFGKQETRHQPWE